MKIAAYLLCLAGVFTTWMLGISYTNKLQLPCGGSSGCTAVALSPAARIAGVPTPLLGLVFFFILLVATRPSTKSHRHSEQAILYWFALSGAAISTGFTIYSLAMLHASCVWCLATNVIACLVAIALGFGRPTSLTKAQASLTLLAGAGVTLLAMVIGVRVVFSHARSFPWNPAALAKTTLAELAPADSILLNGTQPGPTIVMFLDLQCPACRASFAEVCSAALKHHVTLAIRHRPHRKIHPESYALAVQAEEAAQQEQGMLFLATAFKQNVDDQFKGRALLHSLHMRETTPLVEVAEARIKRDKALAKKLALTETPSIFILRPNQPPEPLIATSVEEALRAER